jgi:hypothetical protein
MRLSKEQVDKFTDLTDADWPGDSYETLDIVDTLAEYAWIVDGLVALEPTSDEYDECWFCRGRPKERLETREDGRQYKVSEGLEHKPGCLWFRAKEARPS